jgi:hypothetical protein
MTKKTALPGFVRWKTQTRSHTLPLSAKTSKPERNVRASSRLSILCKFVLQHKRR